MGVVWVQKIIRLYHMANNCTANRFYLSVDHMEKRPKRISNFEEFTLKKEIPSSGPQSTTEATYYDNGFVGVAQ